MNPTGDLTLVIDAGTTSVRAMLFDREGRMRAVAQRELVQHYPRPGWVEHDAGEIWQAALACGRNVATQGGGGDRIACIGITNQRETVVAWDRRTGKPLHRAIVWQDRRTAPLCAEMREAGHETVVQERTGLLLDPYFSATKMRWLLDNSDDVAAAARSGDLALGTVESWLVWKLTGGAFLTDASNASRTCLLPLAGRTWDAGLCDLFGVPVAALGEVSDNAGDLAEALPEWFGAPLPISGLAGDQQAATVGQACLEPGDTKATYGTGAFVLTNMGREVPRSRHRLVGTVLAQVGGERAYALEGSVFVAGSLVKWLRDSLGVIDDAAQTEVLARSVEDNAGVVVVPALAGLGAPHWRPDVRASISGLSFAATRAHLARAALEAMSHQTHDLAVAFAADGAQWTRLRIDGGMSANDWMAQDMANVLDLVVERPDFVETTALGAGMLAAYGAGLFASLGEAAAAMRGSVREFEPTMGQSEREQRLALWRTALSNLA
ncbi:glycerol kinase [Novosphingobium marinum]|uniref:ATP:glycerol 3-phosphotransferase n=1 Tax=Novosphingobium marinum TaxID=1514948 RepID=A0A7Y9XZJ0_9SPHN|nr:glycerol kinase [Novosphingobium marinum]NYH96173.1 glycerol kinase [Novosphingobium marinum]GGC33081.1 glycerol kinase [Novosphingobium marinum]